MASKTTEKNNYNSIKMKLMAKDTYTLLFNLEENKICTFISITRTPRVQILYQHTHTNKFHFEEVSDNIHLL